MMAQLAVAAGLLVISRLESKAKSPACYSSSPPLQRASSPTIVCVKQPMDCSAASQRRY